MAACRTFVSLVRSCYQTEMRFFRDDLTRQTPVTWFFTDPHAKWCGMSNIFNSRNWYGGVHGWPDLGEVEGASRPWYSGKAVCHSGFDTIGTEDQWEHGVDLADAVSVDPCKGPLVQPFGHANVAFELAGLLVPGIRFSPDIWYCRNPIDFSQWFTLTRNNNGPGCCFLDQADFDITDGPPAFNSLGDGPFVPNPDVGGCFDVHYGPGIPGGDIRVFCSDG